MSTLRRRIAIVAVLAGFPACGGDPPPTAERPTPTATATAVPQAASGFRRLGRRFDARLGVYAIDTGSGREVAHRAGERFPFASTFKALAAGAMLREHGLEGLDRTVPITRIDNAYSPVTERRLGASMTLMALCSARVRVPRTAPATTSPSCGRAIARRS